jgi:hypothetical protein
MSDQDEVREGGLGFLDSIGRLFRPKAGKEQPATPQTAEGLAKLESEFDAALHALNEKMEGFRRTSTPVGAGPSLRKVTAEEREAERARRMQTAHEAIRQDIEKMHARLGTGLTAADLAAIGQVLEELAAIEEAGKDSHSLLPRARYAIAEKLRMEAGELAVARVVALLERQKMSWPDPTHHRPSATPEEVERAQRRRLADLRRGFLADDFGRIADGMRGIVKGWGSDYPDPGSPLWESCVLEGVAAGIWGQLLRQFFELLRRDREVILSQTEASVGKEIEGLQTVLAGGVHSLDQANQAVASALQVVDKVVPAIAWKHVCERLPEARGEFA